MANTDAPNGFTPAYHLYGGTIRPQKLRIASGTSAAIFNGDVVNLSSGYVIQGTATVSYTHLTLPTKRIV